jgi:hypothetical protein
LTSAGRALLDVVESGDFCRDDLLHIPADSFIYLAPVDTNSAKCSTEQTARTPCTSRPSCRTSCKPCDTP